MSPKQLDLKQFLAEHPLERSLLIGYYGGGNYGDELLLEVLQNLLHGQGVKTFTIPYQDPARFKAYHHDFGYNVVGWDVRSLLKGLLKSRQVIVGGGGLWGLDASFKILLFGVLLFAARWIFGKQVYLLGVGYYNSAPRMGRISAWLAGKSANAILARDSETYEKFQPINAETYLDKDMSWYIRDIDLTPYAEDVDRLEQALHVHGKTLFVIPRRFAAKHANEFTAQLERFIATNPDKAIILGLLEPRQKYPEGYELLKTWQQEHANIQLAECACNPLALFLFFKKYKDQLVLIAPQFHAIISAYLNDVPFLPVVYDNKVAALLTQIGTTEHISIWDLTAEHVQQFVDKQFGTAEGGMAGP